MKRATEVEGNLVAEETKIKHGLKRDDQEADHPGAWITLLGLKIDPKLNLTTKIAKIAKGKSRWESQIGLADACHLVGLICPLELFGIGVAQLLPASSATNPDIS